MTTYTPTEDYDYLCIIKIDDKTTRVWLNAPDTDTVTFMIHNMYGADTVIYDISPIN